MKRESCRRTCLSLAVIGSLALMSSIATTSAFATGAPKIEEESVSGITSTNATLEARINPNGFRAHYQFQIVADPEEYASEILCPEPPRSLAFCIGEYAEGVLSIGFIFKEITTVSLDLSSEGVTLQPDTTYHYRVLAARAVPSEDTIEWITPIVVGADQTFTTPEEEPTGPTNRRTLTLTKSAGGTGGIGSVSSKPKGINCGAACNEAVASMYKNSTVVLKAKAVHRLHVRRMDRRSLLGLGGRNLHGPMTEAKEVEAVFGGVSKAILNPQPLTLSKGESSGNGTVKATGLACEAECTSETVLYQGPTGVAPKNKPGKTVILKAAPAYGSTFSGWSGCESNPTPAECAVTMEEAAEVTAEFAAKPTTTLTVDKARHRHRHGLLQTEGDQLRRHLHHPGRHGAHRRSGDPQGEARHWG